MENKNTNTGIHQVKHRCNLIITQNRALGHETNAAIYESFQSREQRQGNRTEFP